MTQITQKFFMESSIPQTPDTENIMDFLSSPESVGLMIAMSKVGLPALTGVVRELENQFAACATFPLNHNAPDSNAPNRRNIGWMIRYVMREYGYTPNTRNVRISDDAVPRTRIGKFAGSKYFATSAVYEKTNPNPNRTLSVTST